MFDAQEFHDHHVYRPLIPAGASVNNQHPGLEVILEISESGDELDDDGGRNGDEADDEMSVREGHDGEPGRVQEDSEGGQTQESQESARDEVDSRSSQDWEKLSVQRGTFLHYLDVSI